MRMKTIDQTAAHVPAKRGRTKLVRCDAPDGYQVYVGLDAARAAQAADRLAKRLAEERREDLAGLVRQCIAKHDIAAFLAPQPRQRRLTQEQRREVLASEGVKARVLAERMGVDVNVIYSLWRDDGRPARSRSRIG